MDVPLDFTVEPGATTATFTVRVVAGLVSPPDAPVTISAGTSRATGLDGTLTILRPQVASVTLNPATVPVWQSTTGTVTMTSADRVSVTVFLTSGDTSKVTVPSSVTVSPNATTAIFPVSVHDGPGHTVTLSAVRQGADSVAKQATLTVAPPVAVRLVKSVTLSPTSVIQGGTSTGTVTLDGAAGYGGVKVTLSSSGASVKIPAEVVVPTGATTQPRSRPRRRGRARRPSRPSASTARTRRR